MTSFQFAIQEGVSLLAMVMEVRGIGSEFEYAEHKYVNSQYMSSVEIVPTRKKWEPIVLKRALMPSLYFWNWQMAISAGGYRLMRRNVTIILYNRDYSVGALWNLIGAWPSKITGPEFDSNSQEFATEEITLMHEGIYGVPVGAIASLF
jgi:phage tail-like protein